ncbi:MAG: YSC84-related protein [Candidatus Omnitrophota bacterium]
MRKDIFKVVCLFCIPALIAGFAGLALAPQALAATAKEIDASVDSSLGLFKDVKGAEGLIKKAAGVLVFPKVYKAGIGIGGEYGEGALRINGKTVDYYNTASASIGFQLGGQKKTIIILFMQKDSLDKFRASSGWKAGIDASVAVIAIGTGGAIDTAKINEPIIAFILDQKGLMYNLTLEGSKITKIGK